MNDHPLELPGEVHVAQDADTLYDDLAHALMGAAMAAVKDRGVFHLAVSGGKSPEPFFIRLVTDPRFRAVPWQSTHLWMVDERRVGPQDDLSNWKMIKETLADHVGMRKRQAHPIPVLAPDPATAYEAELRRVFTEPSQPAPAPFSRGLESSENRAAPTEPPRATTSPASPIPRLDLVLLGMGDDGHTASLFPHSDALRVNDRLIVANDGPHVTPPPRVTMTYPLLNAARELAVLVTGAKKHPTLQRVAQQAAKGPDPENLPITGIQPVDGELTWYLDRDAAEG